MNVGVFNPATEVYIVGNDTTDGSIRFQFTTGDNFAHIETRADGVWNDNGLRFASSSFGLGLDMTMSAISGFIETFNPSQVAGHQSSFIPHIQFDDDLGTMETHVPIVDILEIFPVFINAVGEQTLTVHGIDCGAIPSRIIERITHEVGTVGATAPVTVKYFKGTDNTGFLYSQQVLPISAVVANTTLTITYDKDLGFEGGENVFTELSSDVAFSLKIDSGGNGLTTQIGHNQDELSVVIENLVYDENLDHSLDEFLNPVYSEQFP